MTFCCHCNHHYLPWAISLPILTLAWLVSSADYHYLYTYQRRGMCKCVCFQTFLCLGGLQNITESRRGTYHACPENIRLCSYLPPTNNYVLPTIMQCDDVCVCPNHHHKLLCFYGDRMRAWEDMAWREAGSWREMPHALPAGTPGVPPAY